ncbi:MAG: hydrogenase maturation nickel metallochaperone HypA [Bacteroidales bacterium]|nr:hydrogenase maturation nickel metallochaperone HypA [Bacteroidales bacterium]
MHELTVAGNIIDIVTAEAGKAGSEAVQEVMLEIGLLAGIEYESLNFALEALAPGTVIDKATVSIEKPGGAAKCNDCAYEFPFEMFMGSCGRCGSTDLLIIGGNELRVKSITI